MREITANFRKASNEEDRKVLRSRYEEEKRKIKNIEKLDCL